MQIGVYQDLPFAIMRYDPSDEWELRREIKLLATRLESVGKEVHIIPMAKRDEAEKPLKKLFNDNQGQLNAALRLERTTRRTDINEDDFVSFYPYHNYQDPASRTPFTNNPAFRSSLFSPRQSVGLKTLTQAVQQLEDLIGDRHGEWRSPSADPFGEQTQLP